MNKASRGTRVVPPLNIIVVMANMNPGRSISVKFIGVDGRCVDSPQEYWLAADGRKLTIKVGDQAVLDVDPGK